MKKTIWGIILGLALMKKAMANNVKITSPTGGMMEPRGCDTAGCGYFGAPRHGHKHQGLDIKIVPGQKVYAPISGKVRTLYVYPNTTEMKGVEIRNGNIAIKIFYMEPYVSTGEYVKSGQWIGYAQNVAEFYANSGMTPHIHVEVRKNGKLVDPEEYFKNWII